MSCSLSWFLLVTLQFTHYGVPLDPVNATMVTTTVIVVLFSTLVSRLHHLKYLSSQLLVTEVSFFKWILE